MSVKLRLVLIQGVGGSECGGVGLIIRASDPTVHIPCVQIRLACARAHIHLQKIRPVEPTLSQIIKQHENRQLK